MYIWKNISEENKEFYKEKIQEIIEYENVKDIKGIYVEIKGPLDHELFSSIEVEKGFLVIKGDITMETCVIEWINREK